MSRDYLLFVLLCVSMMGVLLVHGLNLSILFFQRNKLHVPNMFYRLRLLILFLCNFSASHAIPIAARKPSLEIVIYTFDCMIAYALSDYTLSENFEKQYSLVSRVFSVVGVMLGVLTGYLALEAEAHDWYMAFLDSFLVGCELILLISVAFSVKDTGRHYGVFFVSVFFMTCFLGLYYWI